MIARNYRTYPEALLYQMELALGNVADTFEAIRVRGGAAWSNLVRRYQNAAKDMRGVMPVPGWLRELKQRAKALAVDVKTRCLTLAEEKHQINLPKISGIDGVDWLSDMRLRNRGIHTMDELAEIAEISTDEACSILKQARALVYLNSRRFAMKAKTSESRVTVLLVSSGGNTEPALNATA